MVSGDNERLLPEPENYAKYFYDLFKNVAEAQRCDEAYNLFCDFCLPHC
jgi:hypothetical protein